MGNWLCKPKTRIARREFPSRKTSSLQDKRKMAESHHTDKHHRASVVVDRLVLKDVEREARPGAEEATVHVTKETPSYVPMPQRDRKEPASNVQITPSDLTKPASNAPITPSDLTKPASNAPITPSDRTKPAINAQITPSDRTYPATTTYITLPEINQKPVREDMRVKSVISKRSFSAENNQECSARSVKRETQLLRNIENKENTNEKMEHTIEKKENCNFCDGCTTSVHPVIESQITAKNGLSDMEDARSKGDCCVTTLPRPESSAFRKDVNGVSENPFDTFDIKTADASTTARIEETKPVNRKIMVSGGLAGGIQQGLRTRKNHGGSARLISETNKKMMTYDEKLQKLQKRDPTMPGPDKGIVWPKSMDSISKIDAAYYVEQFLKSELFRQRCLRKLQGSKSWMNGLSQFQVWVLEHEETEELQEVLHPIKSQTNNAKAKVVCWRGKTPPPSQLED